MDGAVLLIHDEPALRAAARQALTQAGRQVAEAAEVAAALTLADRVRPAVIVLPWLGRRPAREALAQLRDTDATRRSRLIVWAEHSDMPSAVAALEFGADDCLGVAVRAVRARRTRQRVPATAARGRPARPADGRSARARQSRAPSARAAAEKSRCRRPSSACSRSCSRTKGASSAATSCCAARGRKTSRPAAAPSTCTCAGLRQLLEPFGCDDIIQTVRSFGYRLAPPTPRCRVHALDWRRARQPHARCNKSATAISFSLNIARLTVAPHRQHAAAAEPRRTTRRQAHAAYQSTAGAPDEQHESLDLTRA